MTEILLTGTLSLNSINQNLSRNISVHQSCEDLTKRDIYAGTVMVGYLVYTVGAIVVKKPPHSSEFDWKSGLIKIYKISAIQIESIYIFHLV